MYKVLARKYRPLTFDEVCGQRHVVDILKKAINADKVAHAYIFSGPRGTGKTSVARILARSLDCVSGPTVDPCGKCDLCREITAGSCLDIMEIDGASNRGIDEIRALRENVNLKPSKAMYKIYIIDEVHMLTKDAWNALLKTLEEPPEYVKFILATTAPDKILPTILSRCQKLNFHLLSPPEMKQQIKKIAGEEEIIIEDRAIDELYDFSGGSLRDALSILDQLIVYSDKKDINYKNLKEMLGEVEGEQVARLLELLYTSEIRESLILFHQIVHKGKDPVMIFQGFIKSLKDMVMAKIGQSGADKAHILEVFNNTSVDKLLEAVSLIIEYKDKFRSENMPVVLSEVLLIKLNRLLSKPAATFPSADTETEKTAKKPTKAYREKPVKQDSSTSPEKQAPEKEEVDTQKKGGQQEKKEERKRVEKPEDQAGQDASGQWNRLLAELKKQKPTAEAALREGKPQFTEDGKIIVEFAKNFAFHKSLVEKPEVKRLIEKAISELLGAKTEISFVMDANSNNVSLAQDKDVKKVIDFFNGEIVKLEE